jgi:hypothetical protein
MSSYQINAIVTRILVDRGFKEAFLNGQRRQKIREFDLPQELVDAILLIEGDDIHQFIHQMNILAASKKNPGFYDSAEAVGMKRHCDYAQKNIYNSPT